MAAGEEPALDAEAQPAVQWNSWRNLWQVPTILLSVTLIVLGVRSAIKPVMGHDFEGALTQVEEFIAAGKIDDAYTQMRSVIEPNLNGASQPQEARFYAVSADLTFASQQATRQRSEANNRHIATQYAIAEELGLTFSPVRIERWGETMLELGDFDAAEKHLARLQLLAAEPTPSTTVNKPSPADAHGESDSHAEHVPPDSHDSHDSGHAPDTHSHVIAAAHSLTDERTIAADAHARLFGKMIEARIDSPDLDAGRVMQLLAEYRMTSSLTTGQRLWVVAKLAELRLETGRSGEAIDGLLIEMRRLESDHTGDHASAFGELYLLMGRGYHELGDTTSAREHLNRALALLSTSEPARAEALVLLGRMALAEGEIDAAIEKFSVVVNEFVGTHSHLAALLGKAECDSLLGDHATSQAQFREVVSLLRKGPRRRDVSPELVAQRLCDRHDASLAMDRTERALDYVTIAEPLFAVDETPPDVLIRLASTNRQIAEDLLAAMGGASASMSAPVDVINDVDPAVRYEANRRFVEAAENYVRHAAAQSTQPLSEADWGASLWYAAECFDRGGRHRQAIEQFEKYLGSRPADDPRRAEAMFRLAQSHEALLEFEQAAHTYEELRSDRARSSFAAQCHVPLARCYLALNRADEARRTLEEVLSGERLLQPEANDYRDALIELGRLHHQQGEFTRAIERLTEVLQRYPDDSRNAETHYLLADSYRSSAREIDDRLKEDLGISPAESARLGQTRSDHLVEAQRLFAIIALEYAPRPGHVLTPSMEDLGRRAQLYQADCAFQLAQFDRAVELYESASRQYSAAASSMYAMVQIVNCYAALGDSERAAAAHQRALLRLQQLPDRAFGEPDALMDRSAWERWLRNSPIGQPAPSAAANAVSG